jgi:hypothetical protein
MASNATRRYVLGHSQSELERLIVQSHFYGELTESPSSGWHWLGMCVVDVGCGAGDVSFLIASLVGATGSVIRVDRSVGKRLGSRGRRTIPNVTFRHCDLADLVLDSPVDAVVGRFVLLYLPILPPRSSAESIRARAESWCSEGMDMTRPAQCRSCLCIKQCCI